MKKKIIGVFLSAALCVFMLCAAVPAALGSEDTASLNTSAEPDPAADPGADMSAGSAAEASAEPDGVPEAVRAYIVVHGFEWGPGVNKVVLELDEKVDSVAADEEIYVYTAHWDREVTAVFLSDRMGYAVDQPSQYVTFDLVTSYDCGGSPFEYDVMNTEHNYWAETYLVMLSVTVVENGEAFPLRFEGDCIDNHFSPDVVAFGDQGTFSGEYFNVIRGVTETLSVNYAAYEPAAIAGGERNPLLIWLHGRGEGGDDIEITLLANEVSALTEPEIQSHFTAGDETGAYVLVPQVPTYWRDAGDGAEHVGDMPSRYQEILKDLIDSFIEEHPDVDTDRIYILGASNGGFMALEMIEHYPDTFAAAVPVSPGSAYSVYAREDDGSYRMVFGQEVKTGDVYITDEKIELLKQTPIWIVGAATDNITPVLEYSAPLYHALMRAGAENCWCTMYLDVIGTESSHTSYLGHWAWIYLLNDQVSFVQDPGRIAESDDDVFYYGIEPDRNGGKMQVPDGNGGVYADLFDWLNDQTNAS